MAEGDVQFRFFANAQAAEQAIAALEKKYDALEAKIKAVGRTSKKESQEGSALLKSAEGDLMGMVRGYATVGAAVGVVTRAYSEWRAEIERLSAAEDDFGRKLVANLAVSGDVLQGGRIQQWAKTQTGATQEDAMAAFFGVRGGAPLMGLDRAQALAGEVAGARGFINRGDETALREFGELAARIQELSPGKGAGDVVDLATAVQQAAGRNIGQLTSQGAFKSLERLTAGGMDVEQALALAVRGIDKGFKGGSLTDLKPADMAVIGQASVNATAAQFRGAQAADLANVTLKNMRALTPDDAIEFDATMRERRLLSGRADREQWRTAAQAELLSRIESPAARTAVRGIGRAAQAAEFVNEIPSMGIPMPRQIAENPGGVVGLLSQILEAIRGQDRRLNRQANQE